MDSEKLISVLLIVAIIFSVGGIAISLNKLKVLNLFELSGFAISDTGKVNVSISGLVSITVQDRVINFGSCVPGSSVWINKTSNCSLAADETCDDNCTGGDYPDSVNITNDGNVNLEVNFTVDKVAGSNFIGGSEPGGWYISRNSSVYGGCFNVSSKYCGGLCNCTQAQSNCSYTATVPGGAEDWVNISDTTTSFKGCLNLSFGTDANRFSVYAKIRIPYDAPATGVEQKVNMTFSAVQAT